MRPASSYPRHRIDIGFGDLAFGLGACLWARRRARLVAEVEGRVSPPHDAIACLSVRSGFDLLLGALDLPAGSEVLVSAVTHPDMVGILELHGLRAIPVDLDLETLEPRPGLLRAAVTARTRMILIAHLFGGIADLRAAAGVAHRHGLLLVEDCAQSLTDAAARGDSLADISMFSFGPIKTCTALGGAIMRVRDAELRARMRGTVASWPVQARLQFLGRTAKFALLRVLAQPAAFGLFMRACRLLGRDLDGLLSALVRGFKIPHDDPAFVARIRRQPCAPLLALLLRRLRRFDGSSLERRSWIGEELARALPAAALSPGRKASLRTHWLFPIIVADAPALVAALRSRGFDAGPAAATSAITVVPAPADRPELAAVDAAWMLSRVAFLPVYPQLPDRAVQRLSEALRQALPGDQAAPVAPRGGLHATHRP